MGEPDRIGPVAISDDLGDDLRSRIKSELDPGERLLWSGRPVTVPPRSNRGVVIAGLVAGVLLLLSVSSFALYARDPRPDPTPRGEMPTLVGFGLFTFAGAAVITLILAAVLNNRRSERVKKSGTLYALTDRRAIIWVPETGRGAVKVYTIPRGTIRGVHRLEYADGSGDVLFRAVGHEFQDLYLGPPGFEGIADVRRVEEQVRRTLVEPGPAIGRDGGFA
jgi:hypothetical protein